MSNTNTSPTGILSKPHTLHWPLVWRRARRLLLLAPAARPLIPPPAPRVADPTGCEGLADVCFPLGVAVGAGDLPIQGVAITVLRRDEL